VAEEREKIFKDILQADIHPFFIYESALLVESATYKDFDKIIVVYSSVEEQKGRLVARDGINLQEAEDKIKAQFPLSEKLKVAHYTIDTTGSFENAEAKTLETYHLMKKDFNIS
jgi:dephospho-CoA kinase